MKRIFLYAHGGSGNHGCEAIVRSTINLLGQEDVTLISSRPEEDTYYGIDKLCNIIRNDCQGKLYIDKPFVSIKPVRSSVDVTCDYLRKLPEFDKKDMEDFQYKIGLQSHKSYEIFIEVLGNSNNFSIALYSVALV